ncbi:MAG TPA: glycogen debranching protein GlgX [Steroidobacteraceae bacterium]|nr:glycogen debranching protein GlgX [Steroidobacteraceae bacterium]
MSCDLPKRALPGVPQRLGAHWAADGSNFAVFAGHAEQVELCLFDVSGRSELRRLAMPECTDGVWHAFVPNIEPGQRYGYRAYGPYAPQQGQRYNPNKLLLDPYARSLAGSLRWSDALYGYRVTSPRADLSFDRRDSAFAMPKAVVTVDRFDWGDDRPPRTPWAATVIYEAHLRGLSMRHNAVPENLRGSAAALGHEDIVCHLERLGITAIELLPIHALVHDRPLVERGLVNYWGYNTLAFFAPEPRYVSSGSIDELKGAIKALHAAGIEVLLDVVYNHTCEGSELGPTLSFRGLDNAAYYRLTPQEPRRCLNYTGCGNTLNFSHPRVIQLALDSLRYWVQEFHVDGFRFDLSVTLGREESGFDPGAGFFDAMMQDPTLAGVKLIAEPWDLGPAGFQLGNHPAGMAEWNSKFRDEVRRAWRGDDAVRGALAARLQGSADLFDHHRRRPWASLNFVTAHDGFTLQDWVSYNHKHNEANGENNRDGSDDNGSNNWGIEGPTDDAAIVQVRERVKRAMLATLLFSHGTPMLLSGDEFGHTQHGNNNPYCLDSELTWLDWAQAESTTGVEQQLFLARLLQLRRDYCTLRSDYFQHGLLEPLSQVRDIEWFDENGDVMRLEDWQYQAGRLLCVRRALRLDESRAEVSLLLINTTPDAQAFQLPQPQFRWCLRLDSADTALSDRDIDTPQLESAAHSVQLLTAVVEARSPTGAVHTADDTAVQPALAPQRQR